MNMDTRINLFGIACMVLGWVGGYLHCWNNRQARLKDAQKRAQDAYDRYWNGYDKDEF